MIQFIEANGLFLNLGQVVEASIQTKDKVNTLILLTVGGLELEYDGETAEAILQRLNLLTMQTDSECRQLTLKVAEANQIVEQLRQQQGVSK